MMMMMRRRKRRRKKRASPRVSPHFFRLLQPPPLAPTHASIGSPCLIDSTLILFTAHTLMSCGPPYHVYSANEYLAMKIFIGIRESMMINGLIT
jgi:hypothetical protein